jgi:hypothetical protein
MGSQRARSVRVEFPGVRSSSGMSDRGIEAFFYGLYMDLEVLRDARSG